MLKGRLGLDTARVPHADRSGLLHLERGALGVEDGCLRFVAAAGPALDAGDYQVPHQSVSFILLGPGSTVSHDALRLLGQHGTGLAAGGAGGVRCYTAPPLIPDTSGGAVASPGPSVGGRRGRPAEHRSAHVRLASERGAAAPCE